MGVHRQPSLLPNKFHMHMQPDLEEDPCQLCREPGAEFHITDK